MPEEVVSTAPAQQVPAVPAVPAEGGDTAQKPEGAASESESEAKPEDKTPPTEDSPEKRSGQRRFERRIARLTKEAAEQKARAEFLERQLQEAKPRSAPTDGEPKLEDFPSIEEWGAAKAEYAKKQAFTELTARQQAQAHQREVEQLTSAWEAKADKGSEKYDDFEQVVGELDPKHPFAAAIMEAENGEDIAYHLGKNPKEALRIIALSPRAQIREIGKLEAKLLAAPSEPKKPSSAPAPIKPVNGSSAPANKKLRDVKDYDEFAKRRSAFIAQKR